jgi:hypothetical protein
MGKDTRVDRPGLDATGRDWLRLAHQLGRSDHDVRQLPESLTNRIRGCALVHRGNFVAQVPSQHQRIMNTLLYRNLRGVCKDEI